MTQVGPTLLLKVTVLELDQFFLKLMYFFLILEHPNRMVF